MKTITVYESTDGSRWNSAAESLARDSLDSRVKAIEQTLPPIPSYGQRVAVDAELVRRAKREVVELCREEFPNEEIFKHEPAEEIHPRSFAGRFLSDFGGPLDRVWRWFCCERDGWLYSQPFYAINPDKFERVSVSDTQRTEANGLDELNPQEIGELWLRDSSLERWFPFTAERLKRVEREIADAKRERDESNELLKEAEHVIAQASGIVTGTNPGDGEGMDYEDLIPQVQRVTKERDEWRACAEGLRESADPFLRMTCMQAGLPIEDSSPMFEWMPRAWPVMGDCRKLVKACDRFRQLKGETK